MKKIEEKIEEIRRKPEHIRVRYVWAATIISMTFVLIIWVVSMKSNFNKQTEQSIEQTNTNTPSLRELFNSSKDSMERGFSELKNTRELIENEVKKEDQ